MQWLATLRRRKRCLITRLVAYEREKGLAPCEAGFKYISDRNKPEYTDLSLSQKIYKPENSRYLRSCSAPLIAISIDSKPFRNNAADISNKMPNAIRNSKAIAEFPSKSKENFFTEAK